ncbi:MAG: SDR family NAD(P)-dependent oxidoreductase, partial [Rhodococcus sp. (in: high G+C Gram-positive bacteria)]
MERFDGKVALITGAARGQGRSHAIAFAELGADVVLCDRCEDRDVVRYPLATQEDLDETVRLVQATGRKAISATFDTNDRQAMNSLVERAESELGRIDIAVANAGVSVAAPVQSMSEAQWAETIGSNLTGVFNTVGAVAPGMISRGYGRIITISSMLGRAGNTNMAAYAASKWGVIGLSKSAALDLAP